MNQQWTPENWNLHWGPDSAGSPLDNTQDVYWKNDCLASYTVVTLVQGHADRIKRKLRHFSIQMKVRPSALKMKPRQIETETTETN